MEREGQEERRGNETVRIEKGDKYGNTRVASTSEDCNIDRQRRTEIKLQT
jgi:hypothetical protein